MQHIANWAHSRQSRNIELYHSSPFDWANPLNPILLIGGVHGDEPEGVALAEATLAWLKGSTRVHVPWLLIPCLNPDGYANSTRVNEAGVDLNRNYPARSWSPQHSEPRYFPGPSPGSEPEIKALVDLIRKVKPRLIIHCHSWHPCIVFTGEPARLDAKRLSDASGYKLTETIGYDTPGSLSQFAWHDHQIPVICIEEQNGTPLEQVWGHFSQGIQEIFYDESMRGT